MTITPKSKLLKNASDRVVKTHPAYPFSELVGGTRMIRKIQPGEYVEDTGAAGVTGKAVPFIEVRFADREVRRIYDINASDILEDFFRENYFRGKGTATEAIDTAALRRYEDAPASVPTSQFNCLIPVREPEVEHAWRAFYANRATTMTVPTVGPSRETLDGALDLISFQSLNNSPEEQEDRPLVDQLRYRYIKSNGRMLAEAKEMIMGQMFNAADNSKNCITVPTSGSIVYSRFLPDIFDWLTEMKFDIRIHYYVDSADGQVYKGNEKFVKLNFEKVRFFTVSGWSLSK